MTEPDENKNNRKKFLSGRSVFIFAGLLLVFFIALRPPTDPDMGWHLQDGKYLLEHDFRVARQDIYSYTMSDFPLIMHEWVADILMQKFYEKTNLFSLSVVFALISAGAFVLVSWGAKARVEYRIISGILGIIASIPVLGVRPQMVSLLGLASVIYIIFRFRADSGSRSIFWLPVIFAVWANVHGGFPVGLFFIFVFLAEESTRHLIPWAVGRIRKTPEDLPDFSFKNIFFEDYLLVSKRIKNSEMIRKAAAKMKEGVLPLRKILKLGSVLVLSGLATLLNPYGWRIYIEVVTTIFDRYAKANINEWYPVTIANPMSYQFAIYLSLLAILLVMSFRKTDYPYLAVTAIFLFLGISSWRHMPVFLIVSTPLWISITEGMAGGELLHAVRKKWFLAFMILAIFLVAAQKLTQDIPPGYGVDRIAKDGNYPLEAVRWLRSNPIEGNMFNEYNWGGFLVWQYPEKKVFVDGRMPSWKHNGQKVFEEFNRVSQFESDWQDILKKYNVEFALVYRHPANKFMFLNAGWKEVYDDDLSSVYVRPEQ